VTSAADVEAVLAAHLRHRLARADLPALLAAHRAATDADLEQLAKIDEVLTAVKMTREERQASARVGARLHAEATRLSALSSPRTRGEVGRGVASYQPGNAAVAFALAGHALGLSARESALTYAYSFTSGLVSASLRLLRIGHGEAQAVLRRSHARIEQAVEDAGFIPWDALCPSAPGLDLASARHERLPARLFAS
jgi:urease accessory protein